MASPSPSDPRSLHSPDAPSSPVKHAWSKIVRGDAETVAKKPGHSPMGPHVEAQHHPQIPIIASGATNLEKSQIRVSMQTNAEPGATVFDASNLNAFAPEDIGDARVFDEASAEGEEATEGLKTVVDLFVESGVVNTVAADGTESSQHKPPKSSHGDAAEPGISRPTWRKPSMSPEGESKPQPVMGAVAWPALAEARNIKASESRKSKASGVKTPPSSPAMASSSVQEPASKSSLPPGDGPNPQVGIKQKQPFKGGFQGSVRPAFQPIENGPSSLEHSGSDQSIKQTMHVRMKGNFPANPPVDLERGSHHGPFPNNMRKWRNNRDQGRGNYGWHHHGRGYENAGDMVTLLHEQRIGPRNMPRPHPLMNVNPAFYPVPNFHNGGMYYIPAGAPEFVPPYFPPISPVGGMIHVPDPLTLRSMLLKQIDYYFSIENLCRDVFLRTQMDEQGFVPVSVIARFNRIRTLSSNPMVILEALQQSAVVEVQHDRIRRRNDGGKWRLLRDQVSNDIPGQKSRAPVTSIEAENRKLERADPASLPYSQDTITGTRAISDIPIERLHMRSHGGGSSVGPAERGPQHCSDNSYPLKAQHGSDASVLSSLSELRVSRTGVNESIKLSERDSTAHSSANLNSLQTSYLVPQNQERLRDPRILERSYPAPEPSVDNKSASWRSPAPESSVGNKSASWKSPEGFWMESNTYFMHGDFVQDGSLPSDPEFMLKSHQVANEDCAEVNDRDVQRLINATHAPFGSFIAVP